MQAHVFALRHGNAARDLRQIFSKGYVEKQAFDLAEAAFAVDAACPAQHLPQRFDGGGEPRQSVERMLFGIG